MAANERVFLFCRWHITIAPQQDPVGESADLRPSGGIDKVTGTGDDVIKPELSIRGVCDDLTVRYVCPMPRRLEVQVKVLEYSRPLDSIKRWHRSSLPEAERLMPAHRIG